MYVFSKIFNCEFEIIIIKYIRGARKDYLFYRKTKTFNKFLKFDSQIIYIPINIYYDNFIIN
jgi:hypothetical protein